MAQILLAEGSPIMRPALRDLLKVAGHTVFTAMQGMEALGYLVDTMDIDLIITDFVMPDMDGLAFVRRLRETERYRALPVLVLAVDGDLQIQKQAIAAGATSCLIPPITVVDLQNTVTRMLRRN